MSQAARVRRDRWVSARPRSSSPLPARDGPSDGGPPSASRADTVGLVHELLLRLRPERDAGLQIWLPKSLLSRSSACLNSGLSSFPGKTRCLFRGSRQHRDSSGT
ncbi:hypothetical protein AAFF_G00396010 [Aldrovandia affinis]|uniref:Uncharacterized protein n=1 Tax=Aldrovandia affinis TaxID=143900 RepID=A0AAD7SDU2_9TELE|nr:hypothetical protein AAFF_G00396010 [Aldrovandia affinis]